MKKLKGFTLIELMIVVAIIGILAAVALPKFADLITRSNEGATKGALGSVRSALSIYYADVEGWYPIDGELASLTAYHKYLDRVPICYTPTRHPRTTAVTNAWAEGGAWFYDNDNTADTYGELYVDCLHWDTKSSVWTLY
ncbi:MAG: type II secretion system protein [bacterium]